MARHTVMIGNDRYLVEVVEEDNQEISAKQFRVFRNYEIMNDHLIDSDLYFVDKSLATDNIEAIIWPQSSLSVVPLVSNDATTFNPSYTSGKSIRSAVDNGLLLNSDGTEKSIVTKKIRIWHPTTSIKKDMVIYCDSWVNSVHYHWICQRASSGNIGIGEEIRINQDIYNEYIEVEVPSIDDVLFGSTYMSSNSYIKENEFSNDKLKHIYKTDSNGNQFKVQITDLHLLTQLWKYADDGQSREYTDDGLNSIGTIGMNITLYPWKNIDDNGTYVTDSSCMPSSCRVSDDMKISIKPSFNFIDGTISVVGKFDYPNMFSCISSAWEKIHSTDFTKYSELAKAVEEDDEAMEILGGNPNMVKYTCTVSSDSNLNYIIHEEVAYADKVDDFAFPLKDLFDSWQQVPNSVFIRLVTEDRAIGKNCASPILMITKESLKYTINEKSDTRLLLQLKQDEENNMDKNNFNFINTINCRIVKSNSDEPQTRLGKQQSKPRIIYKPIFFRTQDLQNIILRSNIKQNIGISLPSYVNKVDGFVIKIESKQYHETGRTGSFVLFNIDASEINSLSGKYDLLSNDDSSYISSGNFTIQ